ncbi:MAG: PASTA domain-containing protein, partial [Alistipes sp.]|nr:PASTA domain-containing protein [Alistipes sp.]
SSRSRLRRVHLVSWAGRCVSETGLQRNGKEQERFEPRVIASSICSKEALHEVRRCLQAVCTEGTASAFFSDTTRLRVAAKTGTAQITENRYSDHYLGSMVAFFPADAPRYTVLTAIETQMQPGKTYYGGPLAGPVVSRMVEFIHNRGQIRSLRGKGPTYYPQRIKGGDIARMREVADELSPDVQYDVRKGWGRAQVDARSSVTIQSIPADLNKMPDVCGMGLKDALFLLESRGLRVRFTGAGTVTRQSIPAGESVRAGAVVYIEMKK